MTISICDLIAAVILLLFGLMGYKKGAINSLIDLVGLLISLLAAWMISGWLTEKILNLTIVQSALTAWVGNNSTALNAVIPIVSRIAQICVFVLLFIAAYGLMRRIKQWLKGVNKIPIVGLVNQIAGAVIGIGIGIVLITLIVGVLYYAATFAGNTSIQEFLSTSSFLSLFIKVIG